MTYICFCENTDLLECNDNPGQNNTNILDNKNNNASNAYLNVTRIDVYETLCPQQMLVHKGGKIKNWGGECRDVTPTKSLSQNIRVDVNREVKFL